MASKKSRVLVRTLPETKAALEKAALDQERSVSFILDKMAIEWLRERGYLPTKRKAK